MSEKVVRRRVSLTDGRLVIQKTIVETIEPEAAQSAPKAAVAETPPISERGRRPRCRKSEADTETHT